MEILVSPLTGFSCAVKSATERSLEDINILFYFEQRAAFIFMKKTMENLKKSCFFQIFL